MGCYADVGWAWNVKPPKDLVGPRKAAMPSAEFVESFLYFLYGSTNVFLEHLAAWGDAWTAQDLEHVSISIMLFGGGLVSTLETLLLFLYVLTCISVGCLSSPKAFDRYSIRRRTLPPSVLRHISPRSWSLLGSPRRLISSR